MTPLSVSEIVLSYAMRALNAVGGLIVVPSGPAHLAILTTSGYEESSLEQWQRFSIETSAPVSDAFRKAEPVWVESLNDWESAYPDIVTASPIFRENVTAAIPLVLENERKGAVCLTFKMGHVSDGVERAFILALANECAGALERCRLYDAERRARLVAEEEQRNAVKSARRFAFLSSASRVLSSSLDYRTTLQSVAQSVVPDFADWCVVDIVPDAGGPLMRLAVAHVDPAKVVWAQDLQRRFPANPNAKQGVLNVIRTGRSEFYPVVTREMIAAGARTPEELEVMENLGFRSVIITPLRARGRTLGALTFVTTAESDTIYTAEDLELADEIGQRAGIAIDHSRLYMEAQQEIDERKRFEADNLRLLKEFRLATKVQQAFLHDVLASVTEGKLWLCSSAEDLPKRLPASAGPVKLEPVMLKSVRDHAYDVATDAGLAIDRIYDLVTAVSEASMNAIVHAGVGQAQMGHNGQGVVQVWIEDRGQGINIEHLPLATLERGYTTAGTLGHGFWMMLQSVDRLWLLTGPKGTTVVLEQSRQVPTPAWRQTILGC